MGCGSSNSTSAVAPEPTDSVAPIDAQSPKNVYPPAEAFEVPLDDDDDTSATGSSSIIKRHPPKRLLQRLVEPSANQSPPTIEDLEEKLANAELRRNQFLRQRIERAKETDDNDDSTNGTNLSVAERNERNKRNTMRLMDAQAAPLQIADQPLIADESEPPAMTMILDADDTDDTNKEAPATDRSQAIA